MGSAVGFHSSFSRFSVRSVEAKKAGNIVMCAVAYQSGLADQLLIQTTHSLAAVRNLDTELRRRDK